MAQSNFDQDAANQIWANIVESYIDANNGNVTIPGGQRICVIDTYGNAINLTKQNVNSTNGNEALNINVNNKVTTNDPC